MGIANETDSVPVTTPAEDLGADVRTEQPPGPGPIGEVSDDHVSNILIPLGIIAILILLTAVVFFIIIRKRKRRQQSVQFVPVYSAEEAGGEWESQLLEEDLVKHTNIVKPAGRNQRYDVNRPILH